jgi:hypothetical protein
MAHNPSSRIPLDEAGAVPYTTMSRQMFTANPPVQLEVDEKKRADVIHASAVAMAKQMYSRQQKNLDASKSNEMLRSSSFSRHGASERPKTAEDQAPGGLPSLQEAAYRLAQERLAKLHDEHQRSRDFQEYYGATAQPTQRSRLGVIRGRLTRKRSLSDGELVEDRRRSQQVRHQMSLFSTNLSKVDEQKRARDREAVIAAAQRNVKARLEGIDQKLYAEKGLVAPNVLRDWETKAQAVVLAKSEAKDPNAGKIDLGAGKLIEQEEVDEIAARRVKPVIDDIRARAEEERERQIAAKLDEERRKEETAREKYRQKETQGIYKKMKGKSHLSWIRSDLL